VPVPPPGREHDHERGQRRGGHRFALPNEQDGEEHSERHKDSRDQEQMLRGADGLTT